MKTKLFQRQFSVLNKAALLFVWIGSSFLVVLNSYANNFCGQVFKENSEILMTEFILGQAQDRVSPSWLQRSYIEHLTRKYLDSYTKLGWPHRWQRVFKEDTHIAAKKAITIKLVQELVLKGYKERVSTDPEFRLAFKDYILQVQWVYKSKYFDYLMSLLFLPSALDRGSLPFIPAIERLRLSREDLEVLVKHGLDSPQGLEIIQKKASTVKWDRRIEVLRRIYLVSLAVVGLIVLQEEFKKQLEQSQKTRDESVAKLAKKLENLSKDIQAEQQSLVDLHFKFTQELREKELKRPLNELELLELCKAISGATPCLKY